MISEKMKPLVNNNSAIRAMFEEGAQMKAVYGADQVYDFSLGNPNVPAPKEVKEAIYDILENEESTYVHGYMSNAGFPSTRKAIAESLNRRFGTAFGPDNIIMTVGAASGLNVALKTLLNPGDEVVTFAPYFVEYGSYVGNYDGKLVVVPADTKTFQPNLEAFSEKLSEKTRAVIINTPHNPTGVIYSEETLKKLEEAKISYEVASFALASEVIPKILAFGGVAIMPEYIVNSQPGIVTRPLDDGVRIPIYLAWRGKPSAGLRRILRYLRAR